MAAGLWLLTLTGRKYRTASHMTKSPDAPATTSTRFIISSPQRISMRPFFPASYGHACLPATSKQPSVRMPRWESYPALPVLGVPSHPTVIVGPG